MKTRYLLPALMMSAFAFAVAPASAAPAAHQDHISASPMILAQMGPSNGHDRDRHHRAKPRRHTSRPHYVPGHRYHDAPRGWHRYSRRPHDWNRRGCILVGPLWFCP